MVGIGALHGRYEDVAFENYLHSLFADILSTWSSLSALPPRISCTDISNRYLSPPPSYSPM